MPETQDTNLLHHLKSQFSQHHLGDNFADSYNYFPSLIYVFDIDKNKSQLVNKKRFSTTLGFSNDDLRHFEEDIVSLVFKEDRDAMRAEIEKLKAVDEADEHTFQCRFNHKQGDFRYFKSHGTVLRRNRQGQPVALLFTAEDITDTIKTNEEVTALKALIDDTEDMLSFGSWSWEPATGRTEWTDGICRMLGYTKNDIASSISLAFYLSHISKKDVARVESILKKAVDTETDFECSYTIVTRSGEEKLVSSKGKIIRGSGGEAARILGVTRDITRQAQINNDLLHYKNMILEKEEFLNQGSWEWNLTDDTKNWSAGMYRLFDCSGPDEMNALHITGFLYPQTGEHDGSFGREEWKNILKNKESYTTEKTIITGKGFKKQLETYGKIIHDREGNPQKIIGISRDVTPLRRYEKSLEEKIQELNRSNRELEEFAYIASHDLQEPLRKLTTFSERLVSKFSDRLAPDGTIYLERIGAATENMRVLIENLLEYSRTARSSNHFNDEDLSEILETVKTDLELKIDESGAEIISDPLPVIEVIPSQIKQLFDNLLNNAIKFRKKDEPCVIRIRSHLLSPAEKDALHLPEHKNYYKIAFQDNGIGFEPEYSERIFQIFQRLHGKSEYPGSGIGLAICKKIAENHHGIIFAESDADKGAVFTIILPEKQIKESNEFNQS